ncbi:MAG: bifunctional 2-polyprenyl-6-hydroxyphenol methylase/3-demethylubiquinol 3-O-methyltransferase UbiG [Mariprofundales bacterium]
MQTISDNIDPEEIAKFESLASDWWNENGKFWPLHRMNPVRVRYIAEHCANIGLKFSAAKILDVGCGGGILCESLAKLGAELDGIDRAGKALSVARLHAEQSSLEKLHYHEANAESWAEQHAGSYDIVTCLEVLEHVPDITSVCTACAKLLKPGGMFFFATINRTPKAYALAIIGAEYILGWLPKGTHRYEKLIRPSELINSMRSCDLQVQEVCGMGVNPLEKRFFISDDLAINYLGYACKT